MSKLFGRSINRDALISNEIPLMRYFVLTGGALLALLFATDAIIGRQPAMDSGNSRPPHPRIRIHSELRGPEAVVINTSQPIVVPTPTPPDDTGKAVAAQDPQVAENLGQLASPSMKETDGKEQSKASPQPQPRSNVGKARIKRRPMSYAQRPDVRPFDGRWTFDQGDARVRDSFAQLVPRQPRQRGTKREAAWTRTEHAQRPQSGWFDTGW
ncbi:hypothetical protein [Bradyrhizobium sp. CB2312]|uniref:hypothetical protein n=1 Tax=Bradyrhizobium sp. CB2312 TaxID=3039155 RepID=UPI0024B1B985|nr:hypothetical protein [Bradyrhizobium sp. CB2312]WFU75555.1 hypothetical protein QA642_16915 [Bradyrhizobium sp. CB2312]